MASSRCSELPVPTHLKAIVILAITDADVPIRSLLVCPGTLGWTMQDGKMIESRTQTCRALGSGPSMGTLCLAR